MSSSDNVKFAGVTGFVSAIFVSSISMPGLDFLSDCNIISLTTKAK